MFSDPTSPAFYSWSLVDRTPTSGGAFSRPLGVAETGFYYDRAFNGTGDMVWRYTVQVDRRGAAVDSDAPGRLPVFSEQNVRRTWAALRQHYPLLGCSVERGGRGDGNALVLVVAEHALAQYHHHPGEVELGSISTPEERDAILRRLTRDEPAADHHVGVGRVIVLAREDRPAGTYELIFKLAHFVGDGASGMNLARTFLDVLTSAPVRVPPPLEERLAMALPWEALNPTLKMSGGHAMPRTVTDLSYCTPAVTERLFVRLGLSQSRAIIDAARRRGVTLGAAMPVISQMALARVLHRRYIRGDMSAEEWEHRRRQPMHYGGPLNLRPYLDEEWRRKGGWSEVALMIDFYDCTLPAMPTPFGTRKDADVPAEDGAPPFSVLLSRERFIHRVRDVKRQIARAVEHPLFLDIAHARQERLYTPRKKMVVEHWCAVAEGRPLPKSSDISELDPVTPDFVFTGGLSSIGDMAQALLPTTYPLPPNHPLSVKRRAFVQNADLETIGETSAQETSQQILSEPAKGVAIRIVDSGTYLHSSPMDFFLGSGTTRGHFELLLSYDANVYRREDAEEYLRECSEATLFYFGDEDATPKGRL